MPKRKTTQERFRESVTLLCEAAKILRSLRRNKSYRPTEEDMEGLYALCFTFGRAHREAVDLFWRLYQRHHGLKEVGYPDKRKFGLHKDLAKDLAQGKRQDPTLWLSPMSQGGFQKKRHPLTTHKRK